MGEPIGVLDQNFLEPQQSPTFDSSDPFSRSIDRYEQQLIENQSEVERLKGNKWARIGRMLTAAGVGLNGGEPSQAYQGYNNQLAALQNNNAKLNSGIDEINLKRAMIEQKGMATPETVGSPLALANGNYGIAVKNPDGSTEVRDLGVRFDPKVHKIGDQLLTTTGGNTPVELLSDEQLQKIYDQRIKNKKGELDLKANSEAEKTAVLNAKTYKAYQAGMEGLTKGMEGTTTNPITGSLPALTSAAQTADGAVSAMAPILKSLFREAGEGVFTDKDQELLINMIPTRKDHPEARKAKLEMVDQIVRAKLGIGFDEARPSSGDEPTGNTNIDSLGPPSGLPQKGGVVDGYEFLGGNPNDPNNWRQK
ncbi:hypothetical protein QT397_18115 [Microbulbifer sp. MKSA007]|nr:hypothetical protein QT397_18115 [Microbulbifer sp. MKSA007]